MATWRRCSSCRTELSFEATYWVCSVSTCNRKRTGLFFCSVACWEAHLPTMRHREAWAVEKRAPSETEWARQKEEEDAEMREARPAPAPAMAESPKRRGPHPGKPGAAPVIGGGDPRTPRVISRAPDLSDRDLPRDILIVVSKLKKYIKARSGMSTSDNVTPVLSDFVRGLCDRAIRRAGEDGRRTVLDRDFRGLF